MVNLGTRKESTEADPSERTAGSVGLLEEFIFYVLELIEEPIKFFIIIFF